MKKLIAVLLVLAMVLSLAACGEKGDSPDAAYNNYLKEITKGAQTDNGTLTIALSGRLDTTTAPELEKLLLDRIADVTSLIFDLKDLTYTSSAGLRIFLKAQKLMNRQGEMKLIHTAASIMEVFEMTGFTDIMTIEAAQ